ncbi:hypothetical protein [Paraburkholderia fungorum]|uniref:hypothetical protein n=1 Tax=Paraburkholderia fungorum TaxID=134537 RepID=UPI0011C490C9|nr:hypothetical protein [Paraburkholderia fungorum]
MSFWQNIASYIGPTRFGVQLWDKLALAQDDDGWVAGLTMATYWDGQNYCLSNDLNKNYLLEEKSVYFLSWAIDDVTKVTFETLNNFDYFLTSEFSGCRFVVTDVGVAHVAWSAGGDRENGIGTQDRRDLSEYHKLGYAPEKRGAPKYRRKLSFTSTTGDLDDYLAAVSTNNKGQSYEGGNRALVFGYRVHGGWSFKVLRYDENVGSKTGTWSNFACVWA